jgi:hypothetical protein
MHYALNMVRVRLKLHHRKYVYLYVLSNRIRHNLQTLFLVKLELSFVKHQMEYVTTIIMTM